MILLYKESKSKFKKNVWVGGWVCVCVCGGGGGGGGGAVSDVFVLL